MKRYTPGLCANDLHAVTKENTTVNHRGEESCKACHTESRKRFLRGESRENGTDFCRNDHQYTADNTYYNPSSGRRVCRECQRAARRASFARRRASQ